MIEWVV